MSCYFRDKKGFLSLLGLLLTVAIILYLCYIAFNIYFKEPAIDEETKKSISKEGIDTSSHKAVLDSIREKTKDIKERAWQRSQQIENMGR